MNKTTQLFLLKEITWFLLTGIFTVLLLLPIYQVIDLKYVRINGLLAILCAYYFRFILFKSQIPYLNLFLVEITVAVVNIILFYFVLNNLPEMHVLFDNYNMDIFFMNSISSIPGDEISSSFLFFKKEYLMLSVGALVLIGVFELRLVSSLLNRLKTIK